MGTATAKSSRARRPGASRHSAKARAAAATVLANPRDDSVKSTSGESTALGVSCAESFSVKDAKERFDKLLDMAQEEPVAITKHNRPVAVILSPEEYEHFERLEDAYWEARIEENTNAKDGLGPEESEALIQEILNAPDED